MLQHVHHIEVQKMSNPALWGRGQDEIVWGVRLVVDVAGECTTVPETGMWILSRPIHGDACAPLRDSDGRLFDSLDEFITAVVTNLLETTSKD